MFFNKKTNSSENVAAAAPTSSDYMFIRNALLVVDGSQPSLDATDFAVHFAKQTHCELSAAFVVDTATLDYLQQMRIFVKEERQELEQDLELKGKRYLTNVQALGRKYEVNIKAHICLGRFHQIILKLARELAVDLIIIGGWKHEIKQKDSSSIERQLIMDLAECPVIVVKKTEERK
ncbi:MAG: universal stress protein [Lentisphaeria bacterium]